jgi:hypothetical protein
MDPEMEVMAARIFRSGVGSPAPAGIAKLRQPKTYKAIRKAVFSHGSTLG